MDFWDLHCNPKHFWAGHGAPVIECVQNEAAGCGSPGSAHWHAHPKGCLQCCYKRLGHQCGGHALHTWVCGWTPSIPNNCKGLSCQHRCKPLTLIAPIIGRKTIICQSETSFSSSKQNIKIWHPELLTCEGIIVQTSMTSKIWSWQNLIGPVCSLTLSQQLAVQQVREFQAVIGRETRRQCQEKFGAAPDICLACVGGGSNAIGIFWIWTWQSSFR